MSYGMAQARYASDATETVSPGRLLTMLYDRLVTDLNLAEQAILTNDIPVIGERIGHAQEILLELYGTLDLNVWPDGEGLSRLYLWLVNELMTARSAKDAAVVASCRDMVLPLRDAWHAAVSGAPAPAPASVASAPAAAPATSAPAPTSSTQGGTGTSAAAGAPAAAPSPMVSAQARAAFAAAGIRA